MPKAGNKKLKSNRGASKRFKKTGSGFKCKHAGSRKKLTGKTTKLKRNLRGLTQVDKSDMDRVHQMLPFA